MKKPYLTCISKAFILITTILFARNAGAQAPVISYTSPQVYTVGVAISTLSPKNTGGAVPATKYLQASVLAGSGGSGSKNGTGAAAKFNEPRGIATDAAGNVYVADETNQVIRKITPAGVTTTFAGTVNGNTFSDPKSIAVDNAGNVYVSDGRISKISPTGEVHILAGSYNTGSANGTGAEATFNSPKGLAVDASGNVYVADEGNNMIRKITPAGVVSTLAGSGADGSANGQGSAASFSSPIGVAVDASGNVYVTEYGSTQIRKITPGGLVSTFAGSKTEAGIVDGTGAAARFNSLLVITIDAKGNLYVTDDKLRKISPAGVVTTLNIDQAVQDSIADSYGLAADASGNLYISDTDHEMIRKLITTGYSISPALPAGLNFNSATGVITGTPTIITPTTNYEITAYNLSGSGSAGVTIATNSSSVAPQISYPTPQVYTVGTAIGPLAPANTGGPVPGIPYAKTVTFAGSNAQGSANGTGSAASFKGPQGIASDAAGNVYVADAYNNLIRKITPDGTVTTLAGSGASGAANGAAATASFSFPSGVAVDPSGNVYVADSQNGLIRKITPDGIVSTFAGGGIRGANLPYPVDVATDAFGDVFVADGNDAIVEIPQSGDAMTLASGYAGPFGVAVDNSGYVYFTDFSHRVFKISNNGDGKVTVIAGNGNQGFANGPGTIAMFNNPNCLKIDALGNIYVGDTGNGMVRKITPAGIVSTLAGSGGNSTADGIGTAAGLYGAYGIALDNYGNLFVSTGNSIKKISLTGYTINTALPTGLNFEGATGVISGTPTVITPATNYIITAYNSAGSSSTVLSITTKSSVAAPNIKYTTPQTYTIGTAITALKPSNSGGAVPATIYANATTFAGSGKEGAANKTGVLATFRSPHGLATDAAGNIYIADTYNNLIRKITPAGAVTTFAGSGAQGSANGTKTAASFYNPYGVAIDAAGNLYVADQGNNLIRKITPDGTVTTLAGSGAWGKANGMGTAASFNGPEYLVVDAAGNVYVSDTNNSLIRKITPDGMVSTFAGNGNTGLVNGTGTNASFGYPQGLAIDGLGNIYVADENNLVIRKITPDGVVSTFAGSGGEGSVDGPVASAKFEYPASVAVDILGNVYVGDNAQLIRKISGGMVTTLAGTIDGGYADGVGRAAAFEEPYSLALDGTGNLFVADMGNNRIRAVSVTGYTIDRPLPAGLNFDATTGTISGTPTDTATFSKNFIITAYNMGGSSSATVNITVNSSALVFNPIAAQTYGASDLDPGATTTSGTITYTSSNTAVATIVSGKIHIVGAGTSVIKAINNGNDLSQTLTVNKAALKVTADNQTAIQGQPLPKLTLTYSGFVNNDTQASLTTQPIVSTTAKTTSSQGYYPITVTGGSSPNYTFTYAQGTLTMVTQSFLAAPITGKVYGNSDFYTFGTSTTGVTYSSSNTKIATVNASGMVHIVGAGTVTITFGNSSGHLTKTLTVGKAPLTIKANDQTAIQGQPLPALTLSYTGFVNGDTQAGFTTQPVVSTTAKTSSTQGYYPITVSGGSSANYTFTYAGGTLTMVTQAFLQAALTKTYGNADFYTFGTSTTGVTYSSSNTKVATVNASGLLHIVGAGTTTITFGNSSGHLTKTLTVSKAALKVTADDKTKVVLADNPPLTITYSGFVNGDTKANLTTQPTASTTANASTGPGTYPITVSGGVSTNYAFTYVSGTLTITAPAGHDIPAPQVNAAVSPNGDGINDVMTIAGIDGYPENKVTLIDKSGAKVYEISGYDNIGKAFNGYSNITGKLQQAGTYFYQLQYKADGATKNITGYIVLKY